MPIPIEMPRLSDTMEEGTLVKWHVKVGDKVEAGDVLADVETDKATMELTSFDDGKVARLVADEGQTLPIGAVIVVLAEDGESVEDAAAADVGAASGGGKKKQKASAGGGEADTAGGDSGGGGTAVAEAPPRETGDGDAGRIRVSPVARKIAEEHGVDVATLRGSGPDGRIIKRDVQQAIGGGGAAEPKAAAGKATEAGAPAPVAAPAKLESKRITLSNMRKTIAKRLLESKTTIPHFTVTIAVNADPLLALRETINAQLEAEGVKLSVNDFLVRACAVALVRHPVVNSSWTGDAIQQHGTVNIGVAVALPEEKGGGLVVPTLRDAQSMPLRTINSETKRLANKARQQGLSLEEMSDGTFTLSNLGMFGVDHFEAIINPPQAAILAIGAAIQKPVVRDGELTVGHEMELTISCDHRVIDGATAAIFMATVRDLLEKPAGMLV